MNTRSIGDAIAYLRWQASIRLFELVAHANRGTRNSNAGLLHRAQFTASCWEARAHEAWDHAVSSLRSRRSHRE